MYQYKFWIHLYFSSLYRLPSHLENCTSIFIQSLATEVQSKPLLTFCTKHHVFIIKEKYSPKTIFVLVELPSKFCFKIFKFPRLGPLFLLASQNASSFMVSIYQCLKLKEKLLL